jgi:alkyldihydroxyacetonephosphate synthase
LIEINAAGEAHRPWYDRQRPALFAATLKAAKATLDPQALAQSGSADRSIADGS